MKRLSLPPVLTASLAPASHIVQIRRGTEVVLVEDSEDDAFLAMRALKKSGLTATVTHHHDGDSVLRDFATRALAGLAMPAMVLLDLRMPRRSGLEVLHELRAAAATRHLPVIILTGTAPEAGLPVGDYGNTVLLAKPLTGDAFHRAVRDLGMTELLSIAA